MSNAERTLPPDGAFVVQFASGAQSGGGGLAGRAEHVASGRARRFESIEELMAFFSSVLEDSAGAALAPAAAAPAPPRQGRG